MMIQASTSSSVKRQGPIEIVDRRFTVVTDFGNRLQTAAESNNGCIRCVWGCAISY